MRKKFTMLLTALLCCVGVAKADFTQQWTKAPSPWTDVEVNDYPQDLNRNNGTAANGTTGQDHSGDGHTVRKAETPITVSTQDNIMVSFQWSGGNHSLWVLGVDVINASNEVKAWAYELKQTGGNKNIITYTLSNVEAGEYTLRYFVCDKGSDHEVTQSEGTISVTGATQSNSVTVTYDYYFNEKRIDSKTKVQFPGDDFEAPAIDYMSFTYPQGTVTESTTTVDVICTEALPFISSESYDNAVWQVIDMHSNENNYTWKYVGKDQVVETPVVDKMQNKSLGDEYYWAFVGNVVDGFKIYNKAAGATMTLRKEEDGQKPSVMSTTDDKNVFKLVKSTAINGAFCFQRVGDTYYLNKQNEKLSGWDATDHGSSCRVFTPASYPLNALGGYEDAPCGAVGSYSYLADAEKYVAFSAAIQAVKNNQYDIEALEALDELDMIANIVASEKIRMGAGYYFIKGTGNGNDASWYATYEIEDETYKWKALRNEEVEGVNRVWKFETSGNGYKLLSYNCEQYAVLQDASSISSGPSQMSSTFDGGGTFTVTEDKCAKQILKSGDNVVRSEGSGAINYWSGEKGETWYLVPVTDAEMADLFNFVAKVGTEYYKTLQDAIAAADEAGATVTLIDDITSSKIITINKSLTLDLGGHTVTGTGDRLFRITAAKSIVTIKNGTIENGVKEGRCVETRAGGIELALVDLTLNTTGNASQPFTVGGDSGENGDVIVTMTSTTIDGGDNNSYAITTFNPVQMTIENSVVSGWAALNIKQASSSLGSAGSTFDIKNSELIGVNNAAEGATNNFSTIMFEDKNITLNIDGNSSVARATSNSSNTQYIFCIGNELTSGNIEGIEIQVSNGATLDGTILGVNRTESFAAINTMKVPAEYAEKLQKEGYAVGEPIENLVQVIGVAVAKVGNTNYATLQDAIDDADADATVTLIDDIKVSSAVQVADVITLDLNGNSITRAEGYVFEVTGELTVTGGTIAQSGICYIINDADYKTEAGKTYAISEDKESVDIEYTRTFGHTNWQVLFVPFNIKVTEELLNDFEVYRITGVNEVRVEVADVTEGTTLSAHTPYLIKAKEIGEKTITATNVTLEATKDYVYSESINGYTFTGIYTSEAIAPRDKYVLTGGKWCRLSDKAENGNNVLGAFRVYLEVPAGTTANALSITRGETGIEELSTVNDQQSTVIYDLTGRKVETMDKGIYIVNGRKVVIK